MTRLILIILLSLPAILRSQVWTLDSCIQYAFQKNISINQSELNVKIAEVTEQSSFGNLLPSLNGQASHGYNWGQRIDPFTNQFATERIRNNNFALSTSMTLFSGFSILNTWKQSELNTEASKWNYEKMRNDIALNVSSQYLSVLLNREFLYIAQQNVTSSERQVKRLEKLVFAGQLSEGNLADMQAQLAGSKSSLIAAENNFELSKLALMQLLQLEAKQIDTFQIYIPDLKDISGEEIILNPEITVQAALNNFPEIKSATTQMASADLGLKIAKGAQLPTLNMSYSYGTGYSGASKILTGDPTYSIDTIGVTSALDWVLVPGINYDDDDFTLKPFEKQLKDNVNQSLFFSLTVPIFNGFSAKSNVKRATLNREINELQLAQTKQTLEQSVYRAHADAKAALASHQAAQQSVLASEKAFAFAESRYENGLSNTVDYADARLRLENALATQTRTKYEFIFTIKILEFYQGKTISLK